IAPHRFDIDAKGDVGPVPFPAAQRQGQEPGALQLMLRALLAERCKLTVHDETKEMPIYALVLARSDGRLGPDLHRSETDCAAVAAAARGRVPAPPPGPPQPGERLPCGIRIGPGTMTIGGTSLAQFANSLSMFVGRIVTDRTGLTGNFDLNLAWTPDQAGQRPPGAPALPPIHPNGPPIFTHVT